MLEIIEQEQRLFIAFPFAAKDDFRANFSKARWHPERKMWSVALGSRAKLEQWAHAAQQAQSSESNSEVQETLMTEHELAKTQSALTRTEWIQEELRGERFDLESLKSMLAKSKATLAKMRDHIEAERTQIDFERREMESAKQEIEDALVGLVSFTDMAAAHATMKRFDHSISRVDIEQWESAQLTLIDARNALRNANLELEALAYLAEVKQSRDLVRQIMPGAWYSISKLKA